jgi:protein-S-isoprenylcysteine O-methyltransferase Ste14
MAAVWFKNIIEKAFRSYYKYYRLIYSIIAAGSLVLLLYFQFSHQSEILFRQTWLLWPVAVPLLLTGIYIMMACISKYFINLSGVDVFLKEKREPVLETNGLHNYVRHPLYLGTLLFVWSLFLFFPLLSNLIACGVITIYTIAGIYIEERKLKLEFGEAYSVYSSKVPMLIPFFRRRQM